MQSFMPRYGVKTKAALTCLLAIVLLWGVGWILNSGEDPQAGGDGVYQVEPSVVTAGDTVTLRFPEDHPRDLSVVTPNKSFFYLIETEDGYSAFGDTDISSPLRFQVNELKGRIYRDGPAVIEPVFREQGTYQFYFAENMETEPENTAHFFLELNYKWVKQE